MSSLHISTNLVIGFFGVMLSLMSFSMHNMQALRQVAIFANMAFFSYGVLESQLPMIVLNSILLPLNSWRLFQIRQLVRDIENASNDTPITEWLLPHMTAGRYRAGEVLFKKGDSADVIYYIQEGSVRLTEIGVILNQGELFGEMGIFSSARQRTVSVRCETDCKLYTMTRDAVYKLYYQQPKLGFHLISLIVDRLTSHLTPQPPESTDQTTEG